jgi:hypothetical protein
MQVQLSKAQIEQVKSQTAQTNASTELTKQQLEDLKRYGGPAQSGIFPSAIGSIRRSVERLPVPEILDSVQGSARSFFNEMMRNPRDLWDVIKGRSPPRDPEHPLGFNAMLREVQSAAGRGMSSARAAVPERFLRLLESLK